MRISSLPGWSPVNAGQASVRQGCRRGFGRRCLEDATRTAIDGFERTTGLPLNGAARTSVWHDWRADPFSRGAYSYAVAGNGETDSLDAGGTLFFAGEAFAGASIGTVEGALETGERAADALPVRASR